MGPLDTLGRPLHDLRISVTDRCNFRCTYCMPKEVFGHDFQFLAREQLLTFEEIERLARIFVQAGVTKIRITGGEPLIRREVERLVAMLAELRSEGLDDLTLTTNGSLLPQKAVPLRDAGLDRITVSLDSLDDAVFQAMNDVRFPVSRVLDGIDHALAAGLGVKVNMVVKRGANEDSIVEMAERFRGCGIILRFIEYMDVGTTNGWRLDDVVPADEILERLAARWPLSPAPPNYPGEVANRYLYDDRAGEVGVIASVTRPFCGACTRARISAEGELYTCLFAARGTDLRGPLREGADDDAVAALLGATWRARRDRYSELRGEATARVERVEMSHIGG
jgi:cyclic pyranopterin phosphate synthase